MKRVIGLCFILIGFLISAVNLVEWQIARSAAEEMTKEEVKQYEEARTTKLWTNQNKEIGIERKELPSNSRFEMKKEAQIVSTEVNHETGEKVALLIVPKIEQKYSVRWGTEEQVLKKGVGMFVSDWTTAPNGGGHTVLSGHRDTVFYRMDEIEEQDFLLLEYEDKIYTYQVAKIWITDENDRSIIVKKEKPMLTITTCYPFNYVGNATERYIIQAELIDKEEKSQST